MRPKGHLSQLFGQCCLVYLHILCAELGVRYPVFSPYNSWDGTKIILMMVVRKGEAAYGIYRQGYALTHCLLAPSFSRCSCQAWGNRGWTLHRLLSVCTLGPGAQSWGPACGPEAVPVLWLQRLPQWPPASRPTPAWPQAQWVSRVRARSCGPACREGITSGLGKEPGLAIGFWTLFLL